MSCWQDEKEDDGEEEFDVCHRNETENANEA